MAKAKITGAADFVGKLVKDATEVPQTMIVAGYLGESSTDDCHRLYLSPDLSDWFEIPSDAILHQEAVPGDHLGGVYVWIRHDAECQRGGHGHGTGDGE